MTLMSSLLLLVVLCCPIVLCDDYTNPSPYHGLAPGGSGGHTQQYNGAGANSGVPYGDNNGESGARLESQTDPLGSTFSSSTSGHLRDSGLAGGQVHNSYLAQTTIPFYSSTNDELKYKYLDEGVAEQQQVQLQQGSRNKNTTSAAGRPPADFKQSAPVPAAPTVKLQAGGKLRPVAEEAARNQTTKTEQQSAALEDHDRAKAANELLDEPLESPKYLQKPTHIDRDQKHEQASSPAQANETRKTNRLGEFVNPDYDFGFDVGANQNSNNDQFGDDNHSSSSAVSASKPTKLENYHQTQNRSTRAKEKNSFAVQVVGRNEQQQQEQGQDEAPLSPARRQRRQQKQSSSSSPNGRVRLPPPPSSSSSLMMPTVSSADFDQSAEETPPLVLAGGDGQSHNDEQGTQTNNNSHKSRRNWNNLLEAEDTMEERARGGLDQVRTSRPGDNEPPGARRERAQTATMMSKPGELSKTNKIISGDWSRAALGSTPSPALHQSSVRTPSSAAQPARQTQTHNKGGAPQSRFSTLLASGENHNLTQQIMAANVNSTHSSPSSPKGSHQAPSGTRQQQQVAAAASNRVTSTLAPSGSAGQLGPGLNIRLTIHPRAPVHAAKARFTSSIVLNSPIATSAGNNHSLATASSSLRPMISSSSNFTSAGAPSSSSREKVVGRESATANSRNGRTGQIKALDDEHLRPTRLSDASLFGEHDESTLRIFENQFKYTTKPRKSTKRGSSSPGRHQGAPAKGNSKPKSKRPNGNGRGAQRMTNELAGPFDYTNEDLAEGRDDEDDQPEEDDELPLRGSSTTTRRPQQSTSSEPSRRSARTVSQLNRTANTQQAPVTSSSRQEPEGDSKTGGGGGSALYALYDLTDENSGSSTSEYQTNYTATMAQLAQVPEGGPFADSVRLANGTRSAHGDTPTSAGSIEDFSVRRSQARPANGTAQQVGKTSTKRRDTWERVRALAGGNRHAIPAPLVQFSMDPPASLLPGQRIQSKQDIGQPPAGFQAFRNVNATSVPAPPLPLPLTNYINQQPSPVVGGNFKASDERMGMVRSGFLVPQPFGGSSGGNPSVPIHSLRSLAPAAMALLAHASNHNAPHAQGNQHESGPMKQFRALSQLRALLASQQASAGAGAPQYQAQQQQQPQQQVPMQQQQQSDIVENHLMPNHVDYQSAMVAPGQVVPSVNNFKLPPVNQSVPGLHAPHPMEQMVATSNQLGVSHLAASEPAGSYNPMASMQDYPSQQDPLPPMGVARNNGRGGGVASEHMSSNGGPGGMQDGPSQQRPLPPDSGGDNSDNGGGARGHQTSSPMAEPDQNRGPGGNYNSGGGRGEPNEYPPAQTGGGGGPGGQQDSQGAYPYYEPGGRRENSSLSVAGHSSGDYYGNSRVSPASEYYPNSKHKSMGQEGNNAAEGPVGGYPNSLRSSIDSFEDLVGSPLSTSEYERDLADLDEEFNRHAVFSRPSRPSEHSQYGGPASGLMSDSMLSYSPERYETNLRHYSPVGSRRLPSAQVSAYDPYGPPPPTAGEYLSAAGSISNIIPRPYAHHHHHHHHDSAHHHHNQRVAASPAGGGGGGYGPAHDPDGIWLTDSNYDFSPLASYLSPSAAQYATGASNSYARWRPQRYQSHLAPAHQHQHYASMAHHQAGQQRSIAPYFALATTPTGSYLTTAGTSEQPQFNFLPAYTSAASSVAAHQAAASPVGAAVSAVPTETISFTMSPLAAAAAAAATAIAAADKTRHHHHHGHHAWTFTLPRLASTLAAQAAAPQLTSAPTSMASGSSPQAATLASPFHPQAYAAGQYRPAPGGGSFIFSPVPIYAIGPRVPGPAAPLTTAASGTTPSVLPFAAHAFQPASSAGVTGPAILAYRPASMFASAPLLTSFAYPFRLPLATGTPLSSAYHPLGLTASLGGGHHLLHHHHPGAHHGSSPSKPAPTSTGSSGGRGSGSSLKPFYADLQFAESSKSKANNNNNQNGESSSSSHSHSHKNFVKTTAGGLTQMARNLTKKMFGSASQVRPQFVAPPPNFEPFQQQFGSSPISSLSGPILSGALPASLATAAGAATSSTSATSASAPAPTGGGGISSASAHNLGGSASAIR